MHRPVRLYLLRQKVCVVVFALNAQNFWLITCQMTSSCCIPGWLIRAPQQSSSPSPFFLYPRQQAAHLAFSTLTYFSTKLQRVRVSRGTAEGIRAGGEGRGRNGRDCRIPNHRGVIAFPEVTLLMLLFSHSPRDGRCTADLGLLRSRERVHSESLHRVVSNERVSRRRVVGVPRAEAAVDPSGGPISRPRHAAAAMTSLLLPTRTCFEVYAWRIRPPIGVGHE